MELKYLAASFQDYVVPGFFWRTKTGKGWRKQMAGTVRLYVRVQAPLKLLIRNRLAIIKHIKRAIVMRNKLAEVCYGYPK